MASIPLTETEFADALENGADETACFHCGLPVPEGAAYRVVWNNTAYPLCCRGCEAVAHAILDGNLDDYYRFRTVPPRKNPAQNRAAADDDLAVYDHPSIQKDFVRNDGRGSEASLLLEGLTCSACAWLIEQQLQRLPGVVETQLNYSTRRARVLWDSDRVRLSDILRTVREIGYAASPYDPARSQRLQDRERLGLLGRLGLAGIMAMQTMLLSEALYYGDWAGSDPGLRSLFLLLSFVLTLPVLAYSAQPFFKGAWRDITHGRAGMDVPVALGLLAAFAASAWTTFTGAGIAYYDAVTMFVFLLLGARYLERAVIGDAARAAESVTRAAPIVAHRRNGVNGLVDVAAAELKPGDVIVVRAGETVPADGLVTEGRSTVNESLMTGESHPHHKYAGSRILGGSINIESPLTVQVKRVGDNTLYAGLRRLLERAQAEKPPLAQLTDRVAGGFVAGLLVATTVIGVYWWYHDSTRMLSVVVALLVITCPCALSLAAPAAITAVTGMLARNGLLVTRGAALDVLARATHFVFDKTGTLTLDNLRVAWIVPFTEMPESDCLQLAAALEQYSSHPVARAIRTRSAGVNNLQSRRVEQFPGEGITGVVDGRRLMLGSPSFIARATGLPPDDDRLRDLLWHNLTVVLLADESRLLAAFGLDATLRQGATDLFCELEKAGKTVVLMTGDRAEAANAVARKFCIGQVHAALTPAEKLMHVRKLQAQGAVVAMVGDGANDAPVLGGADISIAIGSGADIAAAAADMILLSPNLRQLALGLRAARRFRGVIRQNVVWALVYNLVAIPVAAAGWVTPWLAALGMSLSSIVVVANAWRLSRVK